MEPTKTNPVGNQITLEEFTQHLENKTRSFLSEHILSRPESTSSNTLIEKNVTVENPQGYKAGMESIYKKVVLKKPARHNETLVHARPHPTTCTLLFLNLCTALQKTENINLSLLPDIVLFTRETGLNLNELTAKLGKEVDSPGKKSILATIAKVQTIGRDRSAPISPEELIASFSRYNITTREEQLEHATAVLTMRGCTNIKEFAKSMQLNTEEINQLAKSLALSGLNSTAEELSSLLPPLERFEIAKICVKNSNFHTDEINRFKLTKGQIFEILKSKTEGSEQILKLAVWKQVYSLDLESAEKEEIIRQLLALMPDCTEYWDGKDPLPLDIRITMATKGNLEAYKGLPDNEKQDRAICEAAVSKNPKIFAFIPAHLENDPEIVRLAINKAIQAESRECWWVLSNNPNITTADAQEALTKNPDFYQFMPEQIRSDPFFLNNFGLPSAKKGSYECWRALPESERAKPENALEAVQHNIGLFIILAPDLQKEESILGYVKTQARKGDFTAWQVLPAAEQKADIASQMVENNPRAYFDLTYAQSGLTENPSVVIGFLRGMTLAKIELKETYEIVDKYLNKEGFEELKAAVEFALVLFKEEGLTLFKEDLDDASRIKRYLTIHSKLPMDLQQVLANRSAGLPKDRIPVKDIEWALRYVAFKYEK